MELLRFGPGGEAGHEVELSEELPDDLTGILALTQLFELLKDAREGLFCLGNRAVRVVLPLELETLMVLVELLAEKLGQTLTGGAVQRTLCARDIDGRQATLRSHSVGLRSV